MSTMLYPRYIFAENGQTVVDALNYFMRVHDTGSFMVRMSDIADSLVVIRNGWEIDETSERYGDRKDLSLANFGDDQFGPQSQPGLTYGELVPRPHSTALFVVDDLKRGDILACAHTFDVYKCTAKVTVTDITADPSVKVDPFGT